MFTKMLVQDNLHLYLLRREAALFECMILVDEFDGDNGFGSVVRDGFADGGICPLSDGFADESEW